MSKGDLAVGVFDVSADADIAIIAIATRECEEAKHR